MQPSHPYITWLHCPACNATMIEAFCARVRRKKLSRRAELRLFARVHGQLLRATASPIRKPHTPHQSTDQPRCAGNDIAITSARRLWIAVLTLAVYDLANKIHRSAAESWILSRDATPGSFIWTCDHLDLDHQAVRQRLLRLSSHDVHRRIKQLNEDHYNGRGPDLAPRRRPHAGRISNAVANGTGPGGNLD